MIEKNGIEINVNDLIMDINGKLKNLHRILYGATKIKSQEELTDEMLTFSPDEWEMIAITIKHYDLNVRQLKSLKNQKDIERWFDRNTTFLGYLRDMVCAWDSRLPLRNKA